MCYVNLKAVKDFFLFSSFRMFLSIFFFDSVFARSVQTRLEWKKKKDSFERVHLSLLSNTADKKENREGPRSMLVSTI